MDQILKPIEEIVSFVFVAIHSLLTNIGFNKGPGAAWILSIVFLTIFVRLCILPLFVKQIHSSRKLQAVQPQMKAIQKKYKDKKDQASKEAMSRETMALYKSEGVNPMGSCFPVLIQAPFFFSLFRLLSAISHIANGDQQPIGAMTKETAIEIEKTNFFGIKLSDNFTTVSQGSGGWFVIGAMIIVMCAVMFISQKVIMHKNMPTLSKEGPQWQTQKMMVYLYPVMYIFSGALFPVGVLLYWLTTNIWTAGQSAWQLYFMPTPGSDAADLKEKREKKKEQLKLEKIKTENPEQYAEIMQPDEKKTQRVQPKKKQKKGKK